MLNGGDRTPALPSLSAVGAVFAFVLLLAVTAVGACYPILALPLTAVSGGILAAVLLLHRAPLSVIAPFLCAGLCAVFAKNGTAAVLSFLFLPIGFASAFAVFMRMKRMQAIAVSGCAAAFVGAISLGATILASGLTPAAFFASVKEECIRFLTSHTVLTETGDRMPFLTEASADALISYFTLLLPAILICSLFLLSFFATGILRKILARLGAEADFLPGGWELMPGKLAAAVYLFTQPIAFLCAVLPDAQALYFGFYNVSLVFLLPLAILGITACIRHFRHTKSLGGLGKTALAALALLLAAAGLYWLLTFAAFYGVYIIFRTERSDSASP